MLVDVFCVRVGVWAWCWYPNYFGELLFWCGAVGLGIVSGVISFCVAEIVVLVVMIAFFRFVVLVDFSVVLSFLSKLMGVWVCAGWCRCC